MIVEYLDIENEAEKCKKFLEEFMINDEDGNEHYKYLSYMQLLANRELKSLIIDIDDIDKFFGSTDPGFVESVEKSTRNFIKLFARAADSLLPALDPDKIEWDFLDEFIAQAQLRETEQMLSRSLNMPQDQSNGKSQNEVKNMLPDEMRRRYEIFIKPSRGMEVLPLRQLGSKNAGGLVKIRGIVTMVTDVRPRIKVATYVDTVNGVDYYQEVLGRSYVPLETPPPVKGVSNYGKLEFLQAHSKYVSYQEIKIQERADEVPVGNTPRTILINAIGELTKLLKPGDFVTISGIYTVEPFSGFKAMKTGVVCSCFIDAMDISLEKVSFTNALVTDDELAIIQALSSNTDIYSLLAKSIAPEIYGHEDIKKALLLMMVGGVSNQLGDGIKLRGDIHICLMGDPGVAKSQLLKFITHVAPRAVYTTGKGSSGVGLTAAVVHDEVTKEPCLEGGALVLADRGICCIDEFDKMDEADRTTIHEVMEQQTVSIAKAGITTSLNARSSVLAAANPLWGRYNIKKTPSENIALPAALLSRFDLMWLILDRADDEKDNNMADHILHVHTEGKARSDDLEQSLLNHNQMRSYISASRTFKPTIPITLLDYLSDVYVSIRQNNIDHRKSHTYATPRTFMSVIRLSQALAKLNFRDSAERGDVDEALRLMKMSKISLQDKESNLERVDPVSMIYRMMSEHWIENAEIRENRMSLDKIRDICQKAHISKLNEKIQECLAEYSQMGIITLEHDNRGKTIVYFSKDI